MSAEYLPRLTRRDTLRWIAAAPFISAIPHWLQAATDAKRAGEGSGYGTDPDLHHPVVPWPLLMRPQQLQQAALLADIVLPGTQSAPSPSAIGVQDFVNEWISAPYPDQLKDRAIILQGLSTLDEESTRLGQRGFVEANEAARPAIVARLAKSFASDPASLAGRFFKRFRYLVVGAYYSTPEGFKDIGYTGNVALASYPAVTSEERAILDKARAQLGLAAGGTGKRT